MTVRPPASLVALLALLVLAAGLSGCGSSHSSQRPAVARYIRQVNQLELGLRTPLATVTSAGSQLAATPGKKRLGTLARASRRQQLAAALTQIRGIQAKLKAVPCPAAARHLRSLVLKLTAGEVDLTHQLGLLAVVLPSGGAAAAHTPAVASAQITAVKAYDNAAWRLAGLSQAIASERLRLSNTLS